MLYRYSRWDGTQQGFNPDADDLLNALSDDILEDGDIWRALRKLMQQGLRNQDGAHTDGLRQLLERLKKQRQQKLDRYDLNSLVDGLQERLDRIVKTEREGIQS